MNYKDARGIGGQCGDSALHESALNAIFLQIAQIKGFYNEVCHIYGAEFLKQRLMSLSLN